MVYQQFNGLVLEDVKLVLLQNTAKEGPAVPLLNTEFFAKVKLTGALLVLHLSFLGLRSDLSLLFSEGAHRLLIECVQNVHPVHVYKAILHLI